MVHRGAERKAALDRIAKKPLNRGYTILPAYPKMAWTKMTNQHIQHVINDITGVTGLAIVDAMVKGQRDPVELAKPRDPRIQATEETIRQSLVGRLAAGAHVEHLQERLLADWSHLKQARSAAAEKKSRPRNALAGCTDLCAR
jgi:hypothetical protein